MNMVSQTSKYYANVIKNHHLLSREEERDLFKILQKYRNGKLRRDSRDKIINSNLTLVMHYAFWYSRRSYVEVDDLISAGNEGLAIAVDKFKYKKGVKFSTYAVPWIKLYIIRALEAMGRIVSIPSHIVEKSRKYREFLEEYRKQNISEKEIKERLDITERCLQNVKAAQIKSVSMDQHYGEDKDSHNTLANLIPDSNTIHAPDKVLTQKEKRQLVMDILDELTDLQKTILVARYLSNKNNLSDIGRKLHITGERVRQIEVKALRRLRLKMRQRGEPKFPLVNYAP